MSCLYNDEDIALLDFKIPSNTPKYYTKHYWCRKLIPEVEEIQFFGALESKINTVVFGSHMFHSEKYQDIFTTVIKFISMLYGYDIEYMNRCAVTEDLNVVMAKVKGENIIDSDYSYQFNIEKVDKRWTVTIFTDDSFYANENQEQNYFVLVFNIFQDIFLRKLGEQYPDIAANTVELEGGDGSCSLLIGSINNRKSLSFFCWFYTRLCLFISCTFGTSLSEKMIYDHYNVSNLYYFIQFATFIKANIDLNVKFQSWTQSDLDFILKRFVLLNQNIIDFYGYNEEE